MLIIIIFQVAWRGLADGAQRRGITGSSSPMSTYPIVESAEHKSQLGDLSIFQDKPTRSVQDTIDAKIEFDTLLQGKKPSKQSRNEFAKKHFGLNGYVNPTGLNLCDIYPPMMHRSFNCTGSICLRVHKIGQSLLGNKCKWLKAIKPVARKIDEKKSQIKFDEIGVPIFFERSEELLKEAGFTGLLLDILTTLLCELKAFLPELISLPAGWTRPQYEIISRSALGCGAVFIIGEKLITATMKQLFGYTGYYVDKGSSVEFMDIHY